MGLKFYSLKLNSNEIWKGSILPMCLMSCLSSPLLDLNCDWGAATEISSPNRHLLRRLNRAAREAWVRGGYRRLSRSWVMKLAVLLSSHGRTSISAARGVLFHIDSQRIWTLVLSSAHWSLNQLRTNYRIVNWYVTVINEIIERCKYFY